MPCADFGYTYRHSEAPADIIWIEATFRGHARRSRRRRRPAWPRSPRAARQTQPIREKTGGSTFKNPPGHSSWKLVDEAGWRGKLQRPAAGPCSRELHSNFMINPGEATAADLEGLGEAVRADVKEKFGVQAGWEIKRIGRPL